MFGLCYHVPKKKVGCIVESYVMVVELNKRKGNTFIASWPCGGGGVPSRPVPPCLPLLPSFLAGLPPSCLLPSPSHSHLRIQFAWPDHQPDPEKRRGGSRDRERKLRPSVGRLWWKAGFPDLKEAVSPASPCRISPATTTLPSVVVDRLDLNWCHFRIRKASLLQIFFSCGVVMMAT
jgi:hypothetical protein